ncbi:hypothetical protein K438DRAFT_1999254 [Mycena galopus ATCC 62051]|nr:hypothetical protein K438DRAFT_1999254 [Mycena galopus ATCC 62051]
MAKLYILKYGYHLGDNQDLAEDVEDPPDSAANEVVHEVVAPEVQKERAEYAKNLRGRIGAWYRTEYGNLLKSDQAAFKELFTGALDGTPGKPYKSRILHFYSRNFYETRVKARVEEQARAMKRRAELAGEEFDGASIDFLTKMTAAVWEEETPQFKHECEVALEREYQQQLAAWEALLADSPKRTPEEMAATLGNAALYLQPFADAIRDRFGMCVSVMLAGPIGVRGGRIGVQSVHAGTTKGIGGVNWPTADWRGFQEAEKSMTAFATQCYCHPRWASPSPLLLLLRLPSPCPRRDSLPPPLVATLLATLLPAPPVTTPAWTAPEVDLDALRNEGEEEGAQNGVPQNAHDEYWQRDDRQSWTDELGRAHAAFERGRAWGLEWAKCVANYLDFEAEWGFPEGAPLMDTRYRPPQVAGWLARGRKWNMPPCLGVLGTQEGDDWVAGWWKWWHNLQPGGRAIVDVVANVWKKWASTCDGDIVLVGEAVERRTSRTEEAEPGTLERWLKAVADVTWVLEQLLGANQMEREETQPKKTAKRKAKKQRCGERYQRRRGRASAQEGAQEIRDGRGCAYYSFFYGEDEIEWSWRWSWRRSWRWRTPQTEAAV